MDYQHILCRHNDWSESSLICLVWPVRLVPPGTSYTSSKASLNSKYFQVLAVTNLCSHRRIAWTASPPCKPPIFYNEYKTLPSHAHAFRWDQHHSTQSEERWGYSLVSPVSRGKDLLQLQSILNPQHLQFKCGQNCPSICHDHPRIGPRPAWMDKTEV